MANSPATFSSLLYMGAAKPLAAALQHHCNQLALQQHNSVESKRHVKVLCALLLSISKAVRHELPGSTFCGCTDNLAARAKETAWPEELLSAHLLSVIEVRACAHMCAYVHACAYLSVRVLATHIS